MSKFLDFVVESVKGVIEAKLDAKVSLVDLFLKVFNSLLSDNSPKSVLDVVQGYSKATDYLIIDVQNKEFLKYVGGKLFVTVKDGNNFDCSVDLYFQNLENKWIKKSATSNLMSLSILDDSSLHDLKLKKQIVFEVDPPVF